MTDIFYWEGEFPYGIRRRAVHRRRMSEWNELMMELFTPRQQYVTLARTKPPVVSVDKQLNIIFYQDHHLSF